MSESRGLRVFLWRRKFLFGFLGIVALVFILLEVGDAVQGWWVARQDERFVEALEQWEEDELERRVADTSGGSTPQETLGMYISAVEVGDYELASSYFVESAREEEVKSFEGATEENLQNYLSLLRESLSEQGSFSLNEDRFIVRNPIFVSFIKYPNEVWKIVEI